MKLPIEDVRRQLEEIYESEPFPIYCLAGGVVATGLTNDFVWVLIGLIGFLYFLFKRR